LFHELLFFSWVSVLSNSKEDALNRVFGDASTGKGGTEQSTGLKELTRDIIDEVRRLPGNNTCCDCDTAGERDTFLESFCGLKVLKIFFHLNATTLIENRAAAHL